MRFQITIFTTILIFTILLNGCSGNDATPNAAPNNSSNGQTTVINPNINANSTLTTTKTPIPETTNDAPTLGPIFKTYCEAMTKKDEAGLRKIYSAATLKSLEADMKADNEKSLVKFLENEQVSNALCEVRNEKINGDIGVAEVKTKGMPNGAKLKFVKENGEWKLTTEIPDWEEVKNAAKNSNTTAPANTAK